MADTIPHLPDVVRPSHEAAARPSATPAPLNAFQVSPDRPTIVISDRGTCGDALNSDSWITAEQPINVNDAR